MGKDFEIVAYGGEPLQTEEIAALLARWTPDADFFRQSIAEKRSAPILPGLNCVAFYENVFGDDEADTDEDDETEKLHENEHEPAERAEGGSLAARVQAAWKIVRESAKQRIDPGPAAEESDCSELVRELSQLRGEAFLFGYGDHSCMSVYAQFRDGALVEPQSPNDIYAEHDDYTAWPAQRLSAALGAVVDLDDIAARCFPDTSEPPLYSPARPERAIPFDVDRYMMGLSESM